MTDFLCICIAEYMDICGCLRLGIPPVFEVWHLLGIDTNSYFKETFILVENAYFCMWKSSVVVCVVWVQMKNIEIIYEKFMQYEIPAKWGFFFLS